MPNSTTNTASAVIAIKSKSTHSQSSSPSPPQSSSPPKDAAYLKRREQVRRAQRTHRERKENYIKALEEQVLDLRTKQREIVRENEALTSEVVQLRELVRNDGTPEPFAQNENAWMMAAPSGGSDGAWGGSDMIAWQVGSFTTVGGGGGGGEEAWSWQGGGVPVTWGHTGPSTTLALSHPSRRSNPLRISELDCTDLAVEFIMTLEKPCINRATSTVLDLGERNVDYALHAPSTSTSTYHTFLEDGVLRPEGKEVDANDSLDKLLALSKSFKLEGEVTPIQAWEQIVAHPQFCSIRIETMRGLVEQLHWHVKCYGFGAVINMSIFNELLKNVLVA